MNPAKRLFDRFCRWRHSRGFGIHSPWAYRLVTEAIYPARGYLYYDELTPRLSHPLTALAYRLQIFLTQEGLPLTIQTTPLSIQTTPLSIQTTPDTPLTIPKTPDPLFPNQGYLLIHPSPAHRQALTAKLKATGKGLIIDSRSYLLIITRPQMALTTYTLP